MRLKPGARVGAYEIVALVGAGGMGEVYRARDVRLARDVAVKVVAAGLAADPERLARFAQEARAAAALNHPNILAVHDVGQHDTSPFIVTELLDGLTLRDRLAGEALPVRKAVDYAVQLARALAAAHDKGIVHRDLKPENVFITTDERVKVLDFGLAKLTHPEPALAADTAVPTTPPKTLPGVLLGTIGYMAPEQVRGVAADHRSDIFALGVILYEMLAGRRAFSGDTPMDAMTAILREEPPSLPAGRVPLALERIVSRCLEKNPAARFKSADDLAFALEAMSSHTSGATVVVDRASPLAHRIAWAAGALLLAALASGISVFLAWRAPAASRPELRLHAATPQAAHVAAFSLSPDGTKLLYVGSRLWVRELHTETARALEGTDGAGTAPFWSADCRSIAFASNGMLRRLDLETGLIRSLAPARQMLGGAWNADGTIIFAPAASTSLMRVSADGTGLAELTRLDPPRQISHRFPYFLPDGRHFLFFALGPLEHRGIYLGSLDDPGTHRILEGDVPAVPLPPNSVLFMRDGALLARRINLAARTLEGEPVPVSTQVVVAPMNFNALAASASANGVIGYRTNAGVRDWVWFDRSGHEMGRLNVADPSQPTIGRLSRDGHMLALIRTINGNPDLWTLDLQRTVPRRLTSEPVRERSAIWSPDGARIAFDSERSGVFDLFERSADGGNERVLLASPQPKSVEDWSPDGRAIVCQVVDPKTGRDLWVLPLDGGSPPRPLATTPSTEWGARFSPDGRWIAYESSETGRFEVFVAPFPGPGVARQASTGGGENPQWRADGRELVYAAPGDRVMSVSTRLTATAVTFGPPTVLFAAPWNGLDMLTFSSDSQRFVMTPDAQRFLLMRGDVDPTPVTLLLNWAGLRN